MNISDRAEFCKMVKEARSEEETDDLCFDRIRAAARDAGDMGKQAIKLLDVVVELIY